MVTLSFISSSCNSPAKSPYSPLLYIIFINNKFPCTGWGWGWGCHKTWNWLWVFPDLYHLYSSQQITFRKLHRYFIVSARKLSFFPRNWMRSMHVSAQPRMIVLGWKFASSPISSITSENYIYIGMNENVRLHAIRAFYIVIYLEMY